MSALFSFNPIDTTADNHPDPCLSALLEGNPEKFMTDNEFFAAIEARVELATYDDRNEPIFNAED